ncbi:MAG: VanZ family protein [Bifidobacteriaceae bacterium]|nr:VanZ family protein [Bifidobacteriaceae bacterium]
MLLLIRRICLVAAIIWAVVIFILSAIPGDAFPPRPSFTNVLAHGAAYALLGALVFGALHRPRPQAGAKVTVLTLLAAIGLASLYGVTDELHQILTPGRVADPWDWLTDTVGATLGGLAAWWLLSRWPVRRRRRRPTPTTPHN